MYKEYKDIYELEKEKEYQVNEKDSDYEEKTVDIPFTKEGDLLKVKCQINGLPLHFIFDTGASDVSISTIEATFMFKNDYLSQKDIIGKATYQVANGELIEGTVINIRNVNVGGLVLENIKASVSKSQSAPLLLGQSVLRKLGKVEIDYNKRVIKITYKEKKMTKEA
jgi:clan AA aspartic protease (TIGR02281 family)